MTKYDLEYGGVTCIAVDWEAEPHKFVFIYKGDTYVYEQKGYISMSADTDHIRCVIKSFVDDIERHKMSNLGIAGFDKFHAYDNITLPPTIEPSAKYQPKRSQKIKNKRKGKKRE